MKPSTITWLSLSIALPLFITILHITPAGAAQIARSRSSDLDFLPLVTDLNLVPATANIISPENSEPSNSIEPFWSNHIPEKSSIISPRKRPTKARSIPINKKFIQYMLID
jgi:hypothetical protein